MIKFQSWGTMREKERGKKEGMIQRLNKTKNSRWEPITNIWINSGLFYLFKNWYKTKREKDSGSFLTGKIIIYGRLLW